MENSPTVDSAVEKAKDSAKLRSIEVANEHVEKHDEAKEQQITHRFQSSQAFLKLTTFLLECNTQIAGKTIKNLTLEEKSTAVVNRLDKMLASIVALVHSVDVVKVEGLRARFGNEAFRTFLSKLRASKREIVGVLWGEGADKEQKQQDEVLEYLWRSFGDDRRIDYGTGHELHFFAFLCCLRELGAIRTEDLPAVLVVVFPKYVDIIRMLQKKYLLEPAGNSLLLSLGSSGARGLIESVQNRQSRRLGSGRLSLFAVLVGSCAVVDT